MDLLTASWITVAVLHVFLVVVSIGCAVRKEKVKVKQSEASEAQHQDAVSNQIVTATSSDSKPVTVPASFEVLVNSKATKVMKSKKTTESKEKEKEVQKSEKSRKVKNASKDTIAEPKTANAEPPLNEPGTNLEEDPAKAEDDPTNQDAPSLVMDPALTTTIENSVLASDRLKSKEKTTIIEKTKTKSVEKL